MIHTVEKGDKLLKIVEKYNPGMNEEGLVRRNNRIAAEHGLYEDTVSVTPEGEVVRQPDGIIGDEIIPGMKIKVGSRLEEVERTGSRTRKTVEPVEVKGKWPNKKVTLLGGFIGAALSFIGLGETYRRKREKKSEA